MKLREYEEREKKRMQINVCHLENGVDFIDLKAAYIDEGVTIGEGTVIYPNVILEGGVVIGNNCVIGPGTAIADSIVGDNTEVSNSVVRESKVGSGTSVGPFAYIRPGSEIGDNCKIGDFVEVKNSSIADGSKAPHLAYIGDSDVGRGVNLGCGVVFVNYDGSRKYRSVVKDGAFVGCNVNIVSPVVVEEGAYIAAGSTVTKDVPPGALCVARAKARIIEGWVEKREILKKR